MLAAQLIMKTSSDVKEAHIIMKAITGNHDASSDIYEDRKAFLNVKFAKFILDKMHFFNR